MSTTGPRRAADRATTALARLLVGVYFRRVEVVGAELVPDSGPLIEVAGHRNGLVDGIVLMACSPRFPRFLGKSTLFRIPPLRPFLALAGVVPVYRRADVEGRLSSAERVAANQGALERAARLLADGATIGVFPEGISHDQAALSRLRSGAARLAVDAASIGAPVAVVPVGIGYDDKSRFRSQLLVRFGAARPVEVGARPGAVTASMAADLRALGPEFATVEEAERAARLARLLAARPGTRPGPAAIDELARTVGAAGDDPAVAEVDAAARAYLAELHRLRIDDAHLLDVLGGAPRRARGPRVALVIPTLLGLAVHALPYTLLAAAGRLPRNRGMRSSVKLLGSFGLYPVTYAAIGLAVARRRGAGAGVVAALAAPLCGWAALVTLEADADVTARVRAARLARRGALDPLAETRRALVDRLHAVGLGRPAAG